MLVTDACNLLFLYTEDRQKVAALEMIEAHIPNISVLIL